MNKPLLVGSACLLAYGLALTALPQDAPFELDRVLERAATRRQEYVDTFKDLTAVETRTTEIIEKNGKTEKKRKVVSDLLIYAWQSTAEGVSEYRVAREVDGKLVGKGEKQAIEQFEKLEKAKTFEQERDRLREANTKYSLHYERFGITFQPAPALVKAARPAYTFSLIGKEKVGGRNVVLLRYQTSGHYPSPANWVLLKTFANPRNGERGQIWLDEEDFRIWRWESERTVVDRDIITPVVFMRDVVEYVTSPFGILVPGTITTSFYDKEQSDERAVRLAGRITNTYSAFRRFEVQTGSELQKIRN
jgi:hypothetical protein